MSKIAKLRPADNTSRKRIRSAPSADKATRPDSTGEEQGEVSAFEAHRFKPGQSGNPAGRPKGSRNKLTTEFFDDFYAAWQEHGAKALKDVAENNPRDFVRAAAMLMPKEFEIKSPLNELTDAELADLIAAVQSLIAAGAALSPAGRD